MAERGPSALRWLLKQGTKLDLAGHVLALGHEAAHSSRRILHAGGDATGAEIERALIARLRSRKHITILEETVAVDIARTVSGAAGGVIVTGGDPLLHLIAAPVTVLANGGAGRLWSVTSNPVDASGDGLAMALRAGVKLADLEFAQFHPTVLNVPGVTPFLISEAVRGEGAWLVNGHGERFMTAVDPRAELAPRNIVSGAIQKQMVGPDGSGIFLDLRHLDGAFIRSRFLTIDAHLAAIGLDLAHDLIPVAPAAHYFMGGVVAAIDGRTSMPGLLAIGEVSCTGVHGANRLASNSLLEGLVFGINAADMITESPLPSREQLVSIDREPDHAVPADQTARLISRLQQSMSTGVGVVRTRLGLLSALEQIQHTSVPVGIGHQALTLRNMVELAGQIAVSALEREESRGGHIRGDFPETDPLLDARHQLVQCLDGSVIRSFGALHHEVLST